MVKMRGETNSFSLGTEKVLLFHGFTNFAHHSRLSTNASFTFILILKRCYLPSICRISFLGCLFSSGGDFESGNERKDATEQKKIIIFSHLDHSH